MLFDLLELGVVDQLDLQEATLDAGRSLALVFAAGADEGTGPGIAQAETYQRATLALIDTQVVANQFLGFAPGDAHVEIA